MYHSTDPRAALAATPVGTKPAATHFAGAEYAKFYETPPTENQNGARTWYARGQNFIVAYSEVQPGATFERQNQPDEYVVLVPSAGTSVDIRAEQSVESVIEQSEQILRLGGSANRKRQHHRRRMHAIAQPVGGLET